MKVRRINCPSCGGALEIDDSKPYGRCKYCNSAYMFDMGILKIEYSFADEDTKRDIANANVTLYKFKKYKQSLPKFLKLFEKFQDKPEFLLGIILSSTHEFTREEYSIGELKSILYYWDLFTKICEQTDIMKYQKDIDNIKSLLVFKEKRIKQNKIKFIVFLILCLIAFGVVSYFFYKAEPTRKDVKIQLSKFDGVVDTYIDHDFLNCRFVDKKIVDQKLELEFKCSNYTKKDKKYSYSYEVIDDEPPFIESSDCTILDGEKPDYSCIKIVDSIDGEITDYELDEREADFKKPGTTIVKFKAKDKSGNVLSGEINVVVKPIEVTEFSISFDKEVYKETDKPKAKIKIEPSDKLRNKTATFSVSDSDIASISKDGVLTFKNTGSVKVCAFANYDETKNDCKFVEVYAECRNTYEYELDDSISTTLKANYDYCPGTYKIYAPEVLNKTDTYDIKVYSDSNSVIHDSTLIIWKSAEALNEKGKKVSLGEGSRLVIPAGISKFKLVKVK